MLAKEETFRYNGFIPLRIEVFRMKKRTKKILAAVLLIAVIGTIGFIALRPKLSPYITRITFGISDTIRDRGLKSPEDVERVDDLRYGEDKMQVLDIYYPKGTSQALPTIVSIHGGGYTYGDKERYQYYCMNLAQRGFTVVNFSYRLAPEVKYPAQLNDTNAAVTYICDHADEYYIDTNNIFIVGDSAGAQLNSQYSAAVTNPEYAALLNLQLPDFTLRAIALNCGGYDMKERSESMSYYLDGDYAQYAEELDVLGHITANFPPSFVMSSTGDMALPNAQPMSEFLTEKGVENELHIYGDGKTKPPHVFHCDIRSEYATICNDEECAFFRRYMAQ